MSDIFLSYKSEDRPRAKIIAEALERHGYSVWWDRIIPPGKTFDQVIEEALDASKCVIILWSRGSVSSDWVKNEAREGARRHILIPVLIDNVKIPFEFRHIQAAQLKDWQGSLPNPDFDLLLKSVEEILGRTPVIKIENKKPSINELNILAQQLYEEGKYSEAIEAWKKVLNIDSENRIAIDGIQNSKVQGEEEKRNEREIKARELAEIREKGRQDARQEERRLKKPREKQKRIAEEKEEPKVVEQLSYKKILIAAALIGVVLLGYWNIIHNPQNTPTYTPTPTSTPTSIPTSTPIPTTPIPTTPISTSTPVIPSGMVQGRVFWNELPVIGATVYATELYDFSSTRYGSATTDENGHFSISGIPEGGKYLYVFGNQPEFWAAEVTPFQMVAGTGTLAKDTYLCKGFYPISPKEGEAISTGRPILQWGTYPDAVGYAVRVIRVGESRFLFSGGESPDNRILGNSVQVDVDMSPGEYRWRVDAFNAAGHIIACSYYLSSNFKIV